MWASAHFHGRRVRRLLAAGGALPPLEAWLAARSYLRWLRNLDGAKVWPRIPFTLADTVRRWEREQQEKNELARLLQQRMRFPPWHEPL